MPHALIMLFEEWNGREPSSTCPTHSARLRRIGASRPDCDATRFVSQKVLFRRSCRLCTDAQPTVVQEFGKRLERLRELVSGDCILF